MIANCDRLNQIYATARQLLQVGLGVEEGVTFGRVEFISTSRRAEHFSAANAMVLPDGGCAYVMVRHSAMHGRILTLL